MKVKEMHKIEAHFDKYFHQNDAMVIHPIVDNGVHIDILIYPPSAELPFWKLATMGASDHKMPKVREPMYGIDNCRNEYILFASPEEKLFEDRELVSFYREALMEVSYFPIENNCAIGCGHSFEWGEEEGSDMVGAFITMPEVIGDAGILKCKLSPFKSVACLQIVLLTRPEVDRLVKEGPYAFSSYLYPEDPNAPRHYISERRRTGRF